jgi:putative peptidoglycan lipid II flippase
VRLELSIAALVTLNMVLWFGYQGYVAVALGVGHLSDAFFAAFAVPQMILLVVNTSLTHVLVPFFADKSAAEMRQQAWTMLVAVALFFVAFASILFLCAPWWVPGVFTGFDNKTQQLTVALTRIHLASMVISGLSSVLNAYCHAQHRFIWAETAPVLGNLAGLMWLIGFLHPDSILLASVSHGVRSLVLVGVLLPSLRGQTIFRWREVWPVWGRLRPLLTSACYFKSDQLLDRFFLSMASAGELTVYHFVQQAYSAVNMVLSKALNAPAVPRLAAAHKQQRMPEFNALYHRTMQRVAWASTALMASIAMLGYVVLLMLEKFYNIDHPLWWHSYAITLAMAGVMIGSNCNLVAASGFYAMGNTRVPARVMTITFTLGIAMKGLGFVSAQSMGLALAASAYCLLSAAALHVRMLRLPKDS